MPQHARILSVSTAVPEHRAAQDEVRAVASALFGSDPELAPLLSVFDRSGVRERRFARPLDWYRKAPGFGARNDAFIATATELGETVLARALERARLGPRDLDHLVFATTTGLATPSIDALLLHRMGLRADLERTPLWGIGCAAGAAGLARASDLARARPGALIALVAVELCSLTFQTEVASARNVVGAALFGDGAACVLVRAGDDPGPIIADHRSHTFPGSLELMGWQIDERGLGLVLSRELPGLVEREARKVLAAFLDRHGIQPGALDHYLVHPGGPRVIDAMEAALELDPGALDPTRRLLAAHGNLSSASVLFLLEELLGSVRARAGHRALMVGFGPGFSAELVLLRWS